MKGSVFQHLRAWRHIIIHLLNGASTPGTNDLRNLQGFVIEVYSYLALVSNITPYGLAKNRTLPLDPFLTSLGHLREYEGSGTFFSCAASLFELIPPITMLAAKRLAEERVSDLPSQESSDTFYHLLARLGSWKATPVAEDMATWRDAYTAVGEIYRHALYIYLTTALCGSVVSSPKTISEIQQHIDVFWIHWDLVISSPYGTILLWPLMITGSCLVREDQKQMLRDRLQSPRRWRFTQISAALELLELLWADDDKHAYGPYGLFVTMQKHKMDFCMA